MLREKENEKMYIRYTIKILFNTSTQVTNIRDTPGTAAQYPLRTYQLYRLMLHFGSKFHRPITYTLNIKQCYIT
jgi:hypothetical protein